MSKSCGVLPYKSDGGARRTFSGVYICGLVPLRVLKPKMTAARVVSVRFMRILSKSSWEKSVQKLCFLLLKFAVPVIKFVVVELNLRGGNEFGTRP